MGFFITAKLQTRTKLFSKFRIEKIICVLRRSAGHELAGLIIVGVLLRMVLMPYFSSPYDTSAYCSSLIWFMNGYSPYAVGASIYPPLIYFFLFPLFNLAQWMGLSPAYHLIPEAANAGTVTGLISAYQVNPSFLILWKIPILCFDLLTGLLIYYFVRILSPNSKMPKWCFVIWFFNPFALTISYINGAYDVIAAFFLLLGTFFVYNQTYFWAGLSFGLGTLTKLSPIYIAFPIAAILLFGILNRSRRDLKVNVFSFFRFVAGFLVPLLALAPMTIEYFQRMSEWMVNEVSISGGLNQWFFAVDLNAGWKFINSNLGIIKSVFIYYPLISLIICFLMYRLLKWNRERSSKNVLFVAVLFTALTYSFMATSVQPQYLVWILPLLIALSSLRREFYWPLGLLSFAGLAFLFSIQGFHAVLYPLASYTPLCTPGQVSNEILHYVNTAGIMGPYLWRDLCLIFGGVGFLGLLLTVLFAVNGLRHGR